MQMINSDEKTTKFLWYRDFFKRILDIMVSSVALIIFAIPMLIIAICIKADSKEDPILFKQVRIGKNDVPFKIYKFRIMRTDAPHQMATEKFENPEVYITKIGEKLRKSSLDELPQLLNVLRGDMSIVGPRPLIPKEKEVLSWRDEYGAEKVLPGITGLAQVNGRDELIGEEKAKYDAEYANSISFLLDLKILAKTVSDVVRSRGIHEGKK